jgi:hypothetical protein
MIYTVRCAAKHHRGADPILATVAYHADQIVHRPAAYLCERCAHLERFAHDPNFDPGDQTSRNQITQIKRDGTQRRSDAATPQE